jgi:hypothetical protein
VQRDLQSRPFDGLVVLTVFFTNLSTARLYNHYMDSSQMQTGKHGARRTVTSDPVMHIHAAVSSA